jgi:hypothetical protein
LTFTIVNFARLEKAILDVASVVLIAVVLDTAHGFMLNEAEADQSDAICGDAAVVVVSLGCVFGSCAYG